jgi:hypothetical protein
VVPASHRRSEKNAPGVSHSTAEISFYPSERDIKPYSKGEDYEHST